MKDRFLHIALWCAALLSTAYLLMLGYYALPTADDWGWTQRVTENGVCEFVKSFYYGWQGRYSGLFIDGMLCKWFGRSESLILFTILQLLLGYGAVYLLLRDMTKLPKGTYLALISVLINNLGVMAFPDMGAFYWLCTSNYIHEIWLTMYLVWFIFCCETRWLRYTGTIACSVCLGGFSENYSPTLALALGVMWLVGLYKQHSWRFWQYERLNLLLLSALVVGVGSITMITAPGNDVRAAEEAPSTLMNHFDLFTFVSKSAIASGVLLLRIVSRGWYYICAIPLFIYIGTKSEHKLKKISSSKVILTLVAAIGFIVISVMATVYGVGWYATMRANNFVIFIAMAWLAYVCISTGIVYRQKSNLHFWLTISGAIAILLTSVIYLYQEYPMVRDYHKEVVTINRQMQQYVEEGHTETVYIHPVKIAYRQSSYGYMRNAMQIILHKSKRYQEYYFPYEPFVLTDDVTNWRNVVYKYWLNAQFDVICIDESDSEENSK